MSIAVIRSVGCGWRPNKVLLLRLYRIWLSFNGGLQVKELVLRTAAIPDFLNSFMALMAKLYFLA